MVNANSEMGRRKKKLRKKVQESNSAADSANSLPTKLQLSLLNSRLVALAEQEKAMAAIPQKPVDTVTFSKLVQQRRKYPALLRIEWQVRNFKKSYEAFRAKFNTIWAIMFQLSNFWWKTPNANCHKS